MNNKVNFLRGTSAEYESSTKDNDTFYYTTDDEKLYLGNKEITSSGITIDNALSDTSENPVQNKVINAALNSKADLSDIPTTLPANGGNADTVDGKHASDFALKTDIPTTLPANGGNADTVGNLPASNFLGSSTNFNYHSANGAGSDVISSVKVESHIFAFNFTDTPTAFGFLDVSSFDGEGFNQAPFGLVRQIWTDWANPSERFVRIYKATSETDGTWTDWSRCNADTLDGKHASDFALKTDIPTTLPANGGRSDTTRHQMFHTLGTGTDILSFATSDNCPNGLNTKVRVMHSPTCPTNYGYNAADNDFWYDIYKLDNSWVQIKAYDVRGNVEFINSCLNGTWSGWVRCNDGGNAATVNGLTVQTAVPANAKFTDTTYGAASTSTNGLMTTGAQTLAGNKTFNGQVIPAGASAVGTAQARKIYAGTSDMTAGTTALETGAIYLVDE